PAGLRIRRAADAASRSRVIREGAVRGRAALGYASRRVIEIAYPSAVFAWTWEGPLGPRPGPCRATDTASALPRSGRPRPSVSNHGMGPGGPGRGVTARVDLATPWPAWQASDPGQGPRPASVGWPWWLATRGLGRGFADTPVASHQGHPASAGP